VTFFPAHLPVMKLAHGLTRINTDRIRFKGNGGAQGAPGGDLPDIRPGFPRADHPDSPLRGHRFAQSGRTPASGLSAPAHLSVLRSRKVSPQLAYLRASWYSLFLIGVQAPLLSWAGEHAGQPCATPVHCRVFPARIRQCHARQLHPLAPSSKGTYR
jgi:hypothetical protein